MASAKDVDLFETKDYGFDKRPKSISKKEWAQDKVMHFENSLAAAKTFKFNAEQNKIARDFNAQEAQKGRDWQERMSNTAHQREVKDLKAAGLNPVLAANNGAQSYTTSAASIAGASGKADSDASAIAAYGGSYLNSQAQKYSAKMSAAAMKYSADQALAAAQTQAWASMYNTKQQIIYGLGRDMMDRMHDSWKTKFSAKNTYNIAKEDREEATRRQQYQVDNGTLFGTLNKGAQNIKDILAGNKKPDPGSILDVVGKVVGSIKNPVKSTENFSKIWNTANSTNKSKAFNILDEIGMRGDKYAAMLMLNMFAGNKKAYLAFRRYLYKKYEK